MDWHLFKETVDLQIRDGQVEAARDKLLALKTAAIPRPFLESIADLCRRVRLDSLGLNILRPIIRPKEPVHPSPSIEEWTIYAALLVKVSAVDEAYEILKNQSNQNHPGVLLYSAFAHFAKWEYNLAVPKLLKFIKIKNIDPYKVCIAKVNLAGSLVYLEKYEEAEHYLKGLIPECQKNQWHLLLGNCFEISAQIYIQSGFWGEADIFLANAKKLAEAHNQYALYIEKWQSILELMRSPKDPAHKASLQDVRKKAVQNNVWETVRECDRFEGQILGNAALLTHVYFGTPFDSYSLKVERSLKALDLKISESYVWQLTSTPPSRIFDMLELTDSLSGRLKPGQLLHRLLVELTSDFYQSFTVGTLFSKLFPAEYYNPETSPDRVFQAVRLLRTWFAENKIPVDIRSDDNHYRLYGVDSYGIRIHRNQNIITSKDFHLNQLKREFDFKSFSTGQASQITGMSVTAIRSVLQKAVSEKKLILAGSGRSTTYQFRD